MTEPNLLFGIPLLLEDLFNNPSPKLSFTASSHPSGPSSA